jgi:hypothetical protein
MAKFHDDATDPTVTLPFVSCLMPTYNRRRFITHAIAYFQRQTYANRELIILDDGQDPIGDLVPDDPAIRYERLPRKIGLGEKLNIGCEIARAEIIAHFDDDDWYAPWRLAYEVESLEKTGADVCGINHLLFYDMRDGRAYDYRYPPEQRTWLLGSDLVYRKEFWRRHRFAEIDGGMDGLFCLSAEPNKIVALEDHQFAVHMIHAANARPKEVNGPYWSPTAVHTIARALGSDWTYYERDGRNAADLPATRQSLPVNINETTRACETRTPLLNVYACLVHERPECVIDLVSNLRRLDPDSRIVLYDGSERGDLLDGRLAWSRLGAELCPAPRPMRWGRLHTFALDCLAYVRDGEDFDIMTIVDSDQLALRPGYCEFLARRLPDRRGVGVLSHRPARQGPESRIPPCITAHQEIELWRPFLRRFEGGEEKFVYWSFWPSTVIGHEAGFAILDLFERDNELQTILERSNLWATEEVLFPTLAALLGFEVVRNPCAGDYIKYRVAFHAREVDNALDRTDVFFMHPVPRVYGDPTRARVRAMYDDYRLAPPSTTPPSLQPVLVGPMLRRMRTIEGWLEDDEAELLARVAIDCLEQQTGFKRFVEIGAYCGKATFILASVINALGADARVLAVDRFDGVVGTVDHQERKGPTLDKFKRMLAETNLQPMVNIAIGDATLATCDEPVAFLLVDGLHDYASVAADFYAFAGRLAPGALVAFHDYWDYFPGVRRFVDELVASGDYRVHSRVQCLIVLAPGDSEVHS